MRRKSTSRLDQIDKLLDKLGARLRALELKKAEYGASADPQIMNEIKDLRDEIVELTEEKEQLEANISNVVMATKRQIIRNDEKQISIAYNLYIAEQLADMVKPLIAVVAVLISMWVAYIMTGLVVIGGSMALCATVMFCVLGRSKG
jgi:hypothetical protein